MGILKLLSLSGQSLRDKMHIAFVLMAIIPLLATAYLVTGYIFPGEGAGSNMVQVSIILLFSVWVALGGFFLARAIILPVINLAFETKIIASGKLDQKILSDRDEELGNIANAVNNMTGQIRGYVGELQEYSQKTAFLNAEIHRKVLTLTSLMQLGDLISSGAPFKEIADFTCERISGAMAGSFCSIYFKEQTGRYEMKSVSDKTNKGVEAIGLEDFCVESERTFRKKDHLIIDSRHSSSIIKNEEIINSMRKMKVIAVPLKINAEIVGIIIWGTFMEKIVFANEDIGILKAYSKELVLGYQSAQVGERVKDLEIVDKLTGLYSYPYLEDRLEDEINRAVYYQRPCSLIVVGLDGFSEYVSASGSAKAEHVLKRVGELLIKIAPPVGKVARFDDAEFAVLLPERNKREGIELGEEISRQIRDIKISDNPKYEVTTSIGVGENPIDGANAKEIIMKAREYAQRAREEGKNKVVGW